MTTRTGQHRHGTKRRIGHAVSFKAVDGAPAGTFDAVVSVFGNVDYHGDRMVAGAFEDGNLPDWRASGDPIPVIFTHRWDDLLAHVGIVNPDEVYELAPGDETLPQRIRGNGGLYTRQRYDVEADPSASYAARIVELLERRSLREFSFAFDPLAVRPADGVDEIVRVALWEVGPTLLGANPLTELLSAKARELGVTPKALDAALTELLGRSVLIEAKATEVDDDPEEEVELAEVEDDDEAGQGATEAKAITVTPGGSIEERLDAVFAAASAWAGIEFGDELYALHLEGTYLDEGYAIVVAERWSDPYGVGPIYRLDLDEDERNTFVVTNATEVEVTADFVTVRTELADPDAVEATLNALVELDVAPASTIADATPATLALVKASGKASPQGEAEDHGAEDTDSLTPAGVEELLDELDDLGTNVP